MTETVVLRLTGAGTEDHLREWVAALGRVQAARRVLRLSAPAEAPADLAAWCDASDVVLEDDAENGPT